MSGIKIPIQAAFDKGNVDQALQDVQRQVNQLGQVIAKANKVKFAPVDKMTIQDLQRVTASFESLRRISGDLNRRMRSTGQAEAGFFDLDWAKMYPDQRSRARQMQKAFSYVVGNQFSAAPGGGGGGGGGSPWANAGRKVVNSGLGAAGPIGNVVKDALSDGMKGGLSAGAAGMAGGIAALAIGKAIGAVVGAINEKVGVAQQNAIGYDTLKRTLGDVNVSFSALRESVRASAAALDINYEESRKLSMQFVKLSGMTAEQYKTLAEEVSVGGGFGRSYGLDPSQSNAFFAQMRQFHVTSNTRETRELALMIGESVAKAGVPAKMDEVLDAISSFTAQQARMSLNPANVGGYAEALTGLMSSHRAGLDPASAAALLSRVNASIAGGGSAGEAGQNFLYAAIGSRLGLDPIQTRLMQEQGAFGTGRSTFGKGSIYSDFAKAYGLGTPGAANSDVTNLQMIKDRFDKAFKGRPELMIDAMSNLFSTNLSQSMVLSTMQPKLLGGLSARLKRLGISINDVNATGISRISQIEANGSLSESEKDKQVKDAASQEQERTQGSEIREGLAGVMRATEDAAKLLLTPLNAVRDGVMYLAGNGKMSSRQVMDNMTRLEAEDAAQQMRARRAAESAMIKNGLAASHKLGQAYAAAANGGGAFDPRDLALINKDLPSPNPDGDATFGSLDSRGYRNNNPGNIEANGIAWKGQTGSDGRFAVFDSAESGFRAMGKNLLTYQTKYGLNTVRGIISRWAKERPGDQNNIEGYISDVCRQMGVSPDQPLNLRQQSTLERLMTSIATHENGGSGWAASTISAGASMALGTPLPKVGGGGAVASNDVNVRGEVTINIPGAQSVAVPLRADGNVSRPKPQGAMR